VFGFSLATASTVVLLRAMEERRLLDTRRGKIAIGWLIVEDLACVIALVLIPALAGALGGGEEVGAGDIIKALAITFGKVAAFVAFMLIVGRRAIPWVLERIAGTGSRELFTLAVLSIAMGVAFGSAELFGVSFALGAFFAGMLLNESEFSHQAAQDSLPMRDAFAVLFFVSVGMLFDPRILIEHPLQVLATTLIIVFGKSIAAYAIVRAFGHPNSTALTISTSLAQIGEFAFIIAGLGLSLKILPKDGHDLVLAGALITIMLNPLLFMVLDRWQRREDARVLANTPPEPDVVPVDIGGHAIVVGFGRVGSQLARLLQERAVPVVVVEDDADRVAQARASGFPTVRGNVANRRVMQEAAPERANLAIFAMSHALEAGEAIERLKAVNPALSVLARAHSETQVKHLLEHGADAAVLAERELAYSLTEMVMATPPYRMLRTTSTPAGT
jgi:CPA2 family monovalent cation:H+ antiporter-2